MNHLILDRVILKTCHTQIVHYFIHNFSFQDHVHAQ